MQFKQAHSISGPSTLIEDYLAGGASRLAALLLPQILPVCLVVAPCHAGAAPRDLVLVQRGRATRFPAAACVVAAALTWGATMARAQTAAPAAVVPPEVAAVARAWSLLAQGDAAAASSAAADLVQQYPRSVAVLALAVDIESAQRGPLAALDVYERWLGGKKVEDGYALRRVAHALLRETARTDADRARRLQAVKALVADGDPDVAALLPSTDTGVPEPALAAAGNTQAVDALIAQLEQPGPARRIAIAGLASSRSRRAIPRLIEVVRDPDPTVRTAAVDALAAIGSKDAIPALTRLLSDSVFSVHFAAASALLTLNDTAGLPWLRQLLTSEQPGIRLAAARAMKTEAGADWITVVRGLTADADPEIRRQAAELVAPHDPELARATIQPLLSDPNLAERQAAADSYVQYITGDFAVLRRYLRETDAGTRLRSAERILELTR